MVDPDPYLFAFLDLETTGLYPSYGDRVCEVAIVRSQGNAVLEAFETLVNPERPISPGASAVNGLADEDVRQAPRFAEIAGQITKRLDGCVVVCHNAPFDLGFLSSEFARIGQRFEAAQVIDTLRLARNFFNFPSNSLGAIASRLGIPAPGAHRALSDAQTTREILFYFLRELNGIDPITLAGSYQSSITFAERFDLPDSIVQALATGKRLLIDYIDGKGEATQRWITLKQALEMNDYIYLVAHCHLRDEERSFRLDRITQIVIE